MNHMFRVVVGLLAVTGLALAQGAPPAGSNAPNALQGPGRGSFPAVVIGPPAPVPPEVAIPRPTPAELTQVNDALKKWVASDKSPTKPLLQKFESLMMLQPPRLNVAATYTQTRSGWDRATGIRGDGEQGQYRPPASMATRLPTGGCRATPTRRCSTSISATMKTANFAIAGDTTQGVLWGLKNGEGQGFQPKAIMLMIGTNNSGGHRTRAGNRGGRRRGGARDAEGLSRMRRFCCWRSSRGARRAIRFATKSRKSTRSFRSWTTSATSSTWISAPNSWTRRVLPPGYVPARQPAPAGQGLRHLGRRGEG